MERCNLALILQTNTLVQRFDDNNTDTMLKFVMNIMGYKNIQALLCAMLVLILDKLCDEDITQIHAESIKLAKKQSIQNPKPADKLTSLPELCIHHIGHFLPRKDSVRLGNISRTLFVTTQQKLYLMKRVYNQNEVTSLFVGGKNSYVIDNQCVAHRYATTAPHRVVLEIDSAFMDTESEIECEVKSLCDNKWFPKIFQRAQEISLNSDVFMPYIPIDAIFNKNQCNINTFSIEIFDIKRGHFDAFAAKYKEYFKDICHSNITNIRRIESLNFRPYGRFKNRDITDALVSFYGNFKHLSLTNDAKIEITQLHQLYNIFHLDLESIILDPYTTIKINIPSQEMTKFERTRIALPILHFTLTQQNNHNNANWINLDKVQLRNGIKELHILDNNVYDDDQEDEDDITVKSTFDDLFSNFECYLDSVKKISIHRGGTSFDPVKRLFDYMKYFSDQELKFQEIELKIGFHNSRIEMIKNQINECLEKNKNKIDLSSNTIYVYKGYHLNTCISKQLDSEKINNLLVTMSKWIENLTQEDGKFYSATVFICSEDYYNSFKEKYEIISA